MLKLSVSEERSNIKTALRFRKLTKEKHRAHMWSLKDRSVLRLH